MTPTFAASPTSTHRHEVRCMNSNPAAEEAKSIRLTCTERTSHKEYRIQLVSAADGRGWLLKAQSAAIGGSLKPQDKITEPVPYEKALKEYLRLVKAKLAKGYVGSDPAIGGLADVPLRAFTSTDIRPMLLNPIGDAELDRYLLDPQYSAEEKHDGERRMVVVECDDAIVAHGVNRKGNMTPLADAVDAEVCACAVGWRGRSVFDGESIGDVVYLWDVLEHEGRNLRPLPLAERRKILREVIKPGASVRISRVARTTQDKRRLLEEVRAARREGVVFKRDGSAYVPGLQTTDAEWHKYKFLASATVRVMALNTGRRSVQVEAQDAAGAWHRLGNVTIPPNQPIPAVHAIVEVQYLNVARVGGSLYQPVYQRERADQDESDCRMDQLKYKGFDEAA